MAPKKSPATALSEGDSMPDVELPNQDGTMVKLSSLRGKKLVVYFYPKDDTPGCTRQACAFSENLARFGRLGARVVGISADSVERHRRFADKYQLSFPLLVDEGRRYAERCGLLGEKTLYGKTSVGVIRTTFVLDQQGRIGRIFRKVKVDGHAEEVLAALRELG